MIVVKSRDQNRDWGVYIDEFGGGYILRLHDTSAKASDSSKWNNTDATSNLFSVGTNNGSNASGENYIAYAFHSVPGYSKVWSYTGNWSADGPFVYTGFKPSYLMWKRVDQWDQWHIVDMKRWLDNPVTNAIIWANLSNAEWDYTSYPLDLLSNWFKISHSAVHANASWWKYIYIAFADAPFKYATAR